MEPDKHYHVAVVAWRNDRLGLTSACIKCSPDEDIELGAERFAHLYFSDTEGWGHHAWHYGRIADHILVLEQSAAHEPSYTIDQSSLHAVVLKND